MSLSYQQKRTLQRLLDAHEKDRENGGLILRELAPLIDSSVQSTRVMLRKLEGRGLCGERGHRKLEGKGRPAMVWCITPRGARAVGFDYFTGELILPDQPGKAGQAGQAGPRVDINAAMKDAGIEPMDWGPPVPEYN